MLYNDEGILMTGSDAPLGAGLWMWVITTEDLSVTAFTPHTICRYGDLAFKAPDCSFYDCMNADCTKCSTDKDAQWPEELRAEKFEKAEKKAAASGEPKVEKTDK